MKLPLVAIIFSSTLFAIANPALGYDNTPFISDSGYRVHDSKRPYPEKVSNTSALYTKAPSDAKILFDGTDTSAWNGPWQVKDGILISSEKDLVSKEKFGKIQLHLEFRIPAGRKIEGQKGGNSGIFLMGLFEIQVQESHTNVTYADGQAAAMYGQYPPLVNPASPQGEWQSYDIIFIPPIYAGKKLKEPARVTVLHNGVLVHHAQEFMGVSTFRRIAKYGGAIPEKGPIRIQWHQDPVEFRNIWVRDLGEYSKK